MERNIRAVEYYDGPFEAGGPWFRSEMEAAGFGAGRIMRASAPRLIRYVSEGKYRVISGERILGNLCSSVREVSA